MPGTAYTAFSVKNFKSSNMNSRPFNKFKAVVKRGGAMTSSDIQDTFQAANTCLKLTIETLEQGVKYVQS